MPHRENKKCQACGTQISADEIVHRQAGLVGGVLLCPNCVAQKRQEMLEARHASAHSAVATGSASPHMTNDAHAIGESQGGVYLPPIKEGKDEADETLSLVSEDEVPTHGSTEIHSFAEGSTLAGTHKESDFKRPLSGLNEPATRCRTFHGKLTEAGLAHMDELINEWLDSHPDIYIKTSASSVGVFEGKSKEPHLLVTMFY